MEVAVLDIGVVVNVENRWVPPVQPKEIRRQHPVRIPARLGRAVDRLEDGRISVLCDLVRGLLVDDPGHHGLEARVRLVETGRAVAPRRAGRLGGAACVVAEDARLHAEGLCHDIDGAWGSAVAENGVEGVAADGWVRAHPVVAGHLVGFDDNRVALSCIPRVSGVALE